MTVTSTPIGGRVQFTYMNDAPDLRFSGINPDATANEIMSLAEGILILQSANLREVFHIVESELEVA